MTETDPRFTRDCSVYWGSHGCDLDAGHGGSCVCYCSIMEALGKDGYVLDGAGNVGAWPYYGPDTKFYGDDEPPFATRSIPEWAEAFYG
jgi:hypothetical protein